MKHSFLLRICQTICIFSFFFLLTHSALVLYYAKIGLSSWACSVLPVLLPFIILSKFWIYYDIPQLFYHAAGKTLPHHKHAAICTAILLLGLSSGFPIGAIFVQYYYKEGILAKKEAERFLPLCSFVSPMFLIGYVRPLTGYSGIPWYIFVFCLYLPVLFIFSKEIFFAPNTETKPSFHTSSTTPLSSIREIWLSSLEIIFTIGLYMMLFSILFGITLHEPLLRSTFMELLLSNLEITTGIGWISKMSALSGIPRGTIMIMSIAMGGLCTLAQVYSTTIESSFSMKKYFFTKIKCALLSGGLFFLISYLFY